MKVLSHPRSLSLLCLLATFPLLSGCAANLEVPDTVISTTPTATGTGDIHGNVYGGRQAIQGAHIYLYGAPNTGYGATGISLLGNESGTVSCTGALTADSSGNCYYTTSVGDGSSSNPGGEFNLTGLYTCNVTATGAAQPNQQVWLYSVGGSPGVVKTSGASGPTVVNPSASLTAALGTCPANGNFTGSSGALSYIYVNEVSTVAFAYAVAGFASTSTATTQAQRVGASSVHYLPNLQNAFANAALMYDIQGGADPGDHGARQNTPGGSGITPFLLINTIADSMSTCINSNNQNNGALISTACSAFFQAVYGTSAFPSNADTASAAIFLAQHPGEASAQSVFTIPSSEAPWQPNFASEGNAPADATAAITYAVSGAYGIVLDATGTAYVTQYRDSAAVVKIPNAGSYVSFVGSPGSGVNVSGASNLNYPSGITIDSSGNLWTPGQGSEVGLLYELSSTTLAPVGTSPYTYTYNGSDGLPNAALQIASDTNKTVYLADYQNSGIVEVSNTTPTVATFVTSTGSAAPTSNGCTTGVQDVAYIGSGSSKGALWVTGNASSYDICVISTTGTVKGSANNGEQGEYLAVDSNATAYITAGDAGVYQVTTAGAKKTFASNDYLQNASALAVDGANNVWVLNQNTTSNLYSLVEICTATTGCPSTFVGPNAGFQSGQLNGPVAVAIDGAGDVWITANGSSLVKELIGLAIPVTTPLSVGTGKPTVIGSEEEE